MYKVIQLIEKAEDERLLSEMVRCGIISTKVISYRDMYREMVELMKDHSKSESAHIVAAKFNVSQATVFNAFAFMDFALKVPISS